MKITQYVDASITLIEESWGHAKCRPERQFTGTVMVHYHEDVPIKNANGITVAAKQMSKAVWKEGKRADLITEITRVQVTTSDGTPVLDAVVSGFFNQPRDTPAGVEFDVLI
jgi:hypothetical protein